MHVIALCNQKGGVGKTTTTVLLARAAAAEGRRVAAVDLDPQGNLTTALAAEDLHPGDVSVADTLMDPQGTPLREVAVATVAPGVQLIPAVPAALAEAEARLTAQPLAREARLREALADWSGGADLVLLDCPPSIGVLTANALTAADQAAVVVTPSLFSGEGTAQMLQSIETIRSAYNPRLRLAGLVINDYEPRVKAGAEHLADFEHAARVLGGAPIPRRTAIRDAIETGSDLTQLRRGAPLAQLYTAILTDLMEAA